MVLFAASSEFFTDLVGVLKISSSSIINKPVIEYHCLMWQPIISSTNVLDIDESDGIKWLDEYCHWKKAVAS